MKTIYKTYSFVESIAMCAGFLLLLLLLLAAVAAEIACSNDWSSVVSASILLNAFCNISAVTIRCFFGVLVTELLAGAGRFLEVRRNKNVESICDLDSDSRSSSAAADDAEADWSLVDSLVQKNWRKISHNWKEQETKIYSNLKKKNNSHLIQMWIHYEFKQINRILFVCTAVLI